MPSPFLGMDPYLEGELWQEFHNRLLNQISQQLMPALYPKYVAMLAKRYVIDDPIGIMGDSPRNFSFYPDVHVVDTEQTGITQNQTTPTASPTRVISAQEEAVPQLSIEIRDSADRRLVTVIELLSPANKRGKGYLEYLEKRTALLETKTHLLELDLLRRGRRLWELDDMTAPYLVSLHRFNRPQRWEIWEMPLQARLPVLPVPLLPPDADVALDLQAAVDASYDIAHYELLIDYGQKPPYPAFSAENLQWIHEQIKLSQA